MARKVRFSARQFEQFVYPHVASSRAESDDEFETALRLMRVLKDPAVTEEVPLTREEREAIAEGKAVYSYRRLKPGTDHIDLLLQDDEWKLLKSRLHKSKRGVAMAAAEDYQEILEAADKADECKVQMVPESALAEA